MPISARYSKYGRITEWSITSRAWVLLTLILAIPWSDQFCLGRSEFGGMGRAARRDGWNIQIKVNQTQVCVVMVHPVWWCLTWDALFPSRPSTCSTTGRRRGTTRGWAPPCRSLPLRPGGRQWRSKLWRRRKATRSLKRKWGGIISLLESSALFNYSDVITVI